jgi:hypothetical protein
MSSGTSPATRSFGPIHCGEESAANVPGRRQPADGGASTGKNGAHAEMTEGAFVFLSLRCLSWRALAVLANPSHPGHEEYSETFGEDIDPEAFSLDAINAALAE